MLYFIYHQGGKFEGGQFGLSWPATDHPSSTSTSKKEIGGKVIPSSQE